jgi:predicted dehydrogenase
MPLRSLLQAFQFKRQTTQPRVRIGVVGVGRMGGYHAQRLVRHPGADLCGVVDSSELRRATVARHCRTTAFAVPSDLLGRVEAVVIATPTSSHFDLGKIFLEAGISCLIEKPLTAKLEEAEALIGLAEEKKCVLQVGHIERFNPAVLEAAHHIHRPQFIEVNRLGPYDPRVADIGVVMDLMIHDLDIVLFLVGEPVTRVEAFGAKVLSNHEDIAKVRLHFSGGCIADLSASRVSLKKYRRIRIFQKNAYLSLDYAAPQLQIYRKKSDVVRSLRDIEILKPRLSKKDSLSLELDDFIHCVAQKKSPLVSGRHGRDALHLAQEVLRALKVYA